MSLVVEEVSSPRQRKEFIRLPWRIYRGDPHWVPPLLIEQKERFDPRRNPFYRHGKVRLFLARDGGTPVGRIAAVINHSHNEAYNDRTGFFGFFEATRNYEVARLLFDTVTESLVADGMDTMRGPMNFSVNEECGLLVDGFDSPPYIMMPHNPPYYVEYLERYGFSKAKDLLAYLIVYEKYSDRVYGMVERLEKKNRVRIRPIRMKNLAAEVAVIRTLFNESWEANWFAVPMTEEEIDYQLEHLKQLVDPNLVLVAEDGDKPVGFLLAIPNYNQVLARLNGRLLPFGIFKFLWYRRKICQLRVILMGVIPEYRRKGIDVRLCHQSAMNGVARGIPTGELSWILEDNTSMIRVLEYLGCELRKTYRIYDCPIGSSRSEVKAASEPDAAE